MELGYMPPSLPPVSPCRLPAASSPARSPRAAGQLFRIAHSTFNIRASGAHMHPSYFDVFFWSLLIFVSFLGYGELLLRNEWFLRVGAAHI